VDRSISAVDSKARSMSNNSAIYYDVIRIDTDGGRGCLIDGGKP
jgi:hypothetical protein